MTESWQTCIHMPDGLCPECLAEFNEDCGAWIEFGHHPQGIENWRRLQEEIEGDLAKAGANRVDLTPEEWAQIPF